MDKLLAPLKRFALEQGISISETAFLQLSSYLQLLIKWNQTYNLTAIRDAEKMVSHHLIDSLVIAPYIIADEILDVGTGAGLPGLVMSILFPQKQFTLLDGNGKKIRFVKQVVGELQLKNVTPIQVRLEQFAPENPFKIVTSRAFSQLKDMVNLSQNCVAKGSRFYGMKGVFPDSELASLPKTVTLQSVEKLDVPTELGERHLVILQQL